MRAPARRPIPVQAAPAHRRPGCDTFADVPGTAHLGSDSPRGSVGSPRPIGSPCAWSTSSPAGASDGILGIHVRSVDTSVASHLHTFCVVSWACSLWFTDSFLSCSYFTLLLTTHPLP